MRGVSVKKNAKAIVIAIVAVLVAALVCVFVFVIKPGSRSGNSSRRDDDGTAQEFDADKDLEAMVGDETGTAEKQKDADRARSENSLGETVVEGDVNSPVTDSVQQVQKILIPEAVTIGDGDIGSFYGNSDFEDVIPVDISSFSAKEIPAKYDSRNVDGKSYVTAVEDQGYSYLCWAYACMGAVESDILKHHSDMSPDDIDLSEKHLAYYNLHKATGSLGGYIDNDYRELVNKDDEAGAWVFDYDTGYIASGGVTDYCISLLTAWKGPVEENGTDAFKSIYGASYLFSDNADLPSDAFKSSYHVQAVNQIPGNYGNNTLIKQMIMEHGAASVGICADSKFFKNHSSTMYSAFDGEPVKTADHEVLIIGWDDEYSASNFKITPKGDGAWICKNSWGPGTGDGGCFYLSYYDETTAISNAAGYDVAAPGDDNWYDNNYQVAGYFTNLVSTLDDALNNVRALTESSNPYGVMYEAAGNETLKAIGFMSLDLYQQYELEVYLNPDEEDGKVAFTTDDEPAVSRKISSISGGYHTFELDKEIDLSKGDKFFILIKPVTEGRLVYEESEDMVGEANYDEWQNLTGNIHNNYEASGMSYYIADDGASMVKQTDKDFFVKAYTVNR